MPLFKKIKPAFDVTILVWKIEESLDFLYDIYLNESSVNRVDGMRSEIHKKGFLSIRHLLKILHYDDDNLFYTNDGKPHLKDGKCISITHSFEYAAIIVSNTAVGIDIEMNRPKIIRIANKFIGPERDFLPDLESSEALDDEKTNILIKQLTVIWGAKESLYKIHPDGGLLFKYHLPIEPFSLDDVKTKGWIKKDNFYEVYDIYFEQIDTYTLAYAIN